MDYQGFLQKLLRTATDRFCVWEGGLETLPGIYVFSQLLYNKSWGIFMPSETVWGIYMLNGLVDIGSKVVFYKNIFQSGSEDLEKDKVCQCKLHKVLNNSEITVIDDDDGKTELMKHECYTIDFYSKDKIFMENLWKICGMSLFQRSRCFPNARRSKVCIGLLRVTDWQSVLSLQPCMERFRRLCL